MINLSNNSNDLYINITPFLTNSGNNIIIDIDNVIFTTNITETNLRYDKFNIILNSGTSLLEGKIEKTYGLYDFFIYEIDKEVELSDLTQDNLDNLNKIYSTKVRIIDTDTDTQEYFNRDVEYNSYKRN
jgi:hypothetical protein